MFYFILFLVACVAVVQWRAGAREAQAQSAYPPDGQLIDVGGVKVHAMVKGDGPDLVLIHGASGNTRDFTFDFVDRLTDQYRVIVFDRAGLGWSDRPEAYRGAWNTRSEPPKEQAALLQAAADTLGVRNPIVLGHSYGGAVALSWGLSRPEDTAALVLVAAASNPWPGDLGLLYNVNSSSWGGALVIPMITAFAPQSAIEGTIDSIFAPQTAPKGYLDHVGAGLTLQRGAMRANAQQVNSLRPYVVEMASQYPSLPMPVEIIHGAADTIVPLEIHSRPLSQQIEQSTLTVLDGVGHMPHHVAPEAVIAAIERATRAADLR